MTKLVNRAKMTTATTGTGTITLGTAEAGYQSFADAGVVDADVVRYVIEDGTAWEIGTGTFGSAGGTLTRTVSESSNADAALNLSGSAVVFVGATAADIPPVLELYAENPSSPTAPVATGLNAVAIGNGAVAGGFESISIGRDSNATQANNIALGRLSQATGLNGSFAIGFASTASGERSISIGSGTSGFSSVSAGVASVAIGNSRASGTDSFAAAIANNTASYGATGANSIAIGDKAKASNSDTIAIGENSLATVSRSVAIGFGNAASATGALSLGYNSTSNANRAVTIGENHTASGQNACAIGPASGTASGQLSLVLSCGGSQSTVLQAVAIGTNAVSSIVGKMAYASGRFGSEVYNAQTGTFVLRSDTTDATPESLTTNNSTPSTNNQIILPNNSAYAFHGTIVARQQASQGTATAAWKIEGLIRREGNAASTVLVNSATTVLDNTPGWGMALSADTTNGGLKIEVTGAAATNIRFVSTIHTSEVTF